MASGFSRKIASTSAAVVLAVTAVSAQTSSFRQVDQLSWLAGCWQITRGNEVIDEQWMAPRGGVMLGMSRTVRGGRATALEATTIRMLDGRLAYLANPSGQTPTTFTATSVSGDRVVFENPMHDYPRRIIYERQGSDAVTASIDDGTGARRVEYPYRRIACGTSRSPAQH